MGTKKIVVVGGGPAGLMAAIKASYQIQHDVVLVEKNPTLGKKLLLTGKGRCNLTNTCSLEDFLKRFPKQGAFLRDPFKVFFNTDLMNFFEQRGVALRIERQQRVFPQTDKAISILKVLKNEITANNVSIRYETIFKDILFENDKLLGIVLSTGERILCDCLILATGGVSYPFTGSDGQGIHIATKYGHQLIPLRAGLVPLVIKQSFVSDLSGLTLKNIRLTFRWGKKKVATDIGELLFTPFGISGPLVLSYSGEVVDSLRKYKTASVEIDLKPALSIDQLTVRLEKELQQHSKRSMRNILKDFLPLRLIDLFLKLAGIASLKKGNQVTQKERKALILLLKEWRLDISKSRPLEEGMVTRGGVSLKNINPRTLESRIIKGLYFAGEMMDIDGDTGGFNLQAAFSTGYVAGEQAALACSAT